MLYFSNWEDYRMFFAKKKIMRNQKEWDEYSKGKSLQWKIDHYIDFVEKKRIEYCMKHYYLPRI